MHLLGPYRRLMPRVLGGPGGVGVFLWARHPCRRRAGRRAREGYAEPRPSGRLAARAVHPLHSRPETRRTKPGTRNTKPEIQNPKLETRKLKLETRSPGHSPKVGIPVETFTNGQQGRFIAETRNRERESFFITSTEEKYPHKAVPEQNSKPETLKA